MLGVNIATIMVVLNRPPVWPEQALCSGRPSGCMISVKILRCLYSRCHLRNSAFTCIEIILNPFPFMEMIMLDVFYIALTVGFFGLAAAIVPVLDRS